MISEISGKVVSRGEHSLIIDVNGLSYEVVVPVSVLQRIDSQISSEGSVRLKTYSYIQISPSSGIPVLIGFLNEIERDFFLQFIKVSGIGPRAAVKALSRPISEIAGAISQADYKFLTTLPGIGMQKAREIVAKLQNKVGRYGLIQDQIPVPVPQQEDHGAPAWQSEALDVLTQLQYKRSEALEMIRKALARDSSIGSAEELLNEIYKQRITLS